ncbi:transcriptional regulator, partial [Staphylococcus saprophyticus]|uniref:helix-turn-helix transcriptional regulator n=1 Tax=Staphylococcus saprophyticus TaxID=29385 RepID=UPI000FF7CF5A
NGSWCFFRDFKQLNVFRQTINAIENAKYDPSLSLAFKLAKLFDVTVDELFFEINMKN